MKDQLIGETNLADLVVGSKPPMYIFLRSCVPTRLFLMPRLLMGLGSINSDGREIDSRKKYKKKNVTEETNQG